MLSQRDSRHARRLASIFAQCVNHLDLNIALTRSPCSAAARTVGGTLVLNGDGSAGEGWQMVDLLGSPAASVTVSFEQLFKLFRGPRFTDDLEALASAAGKACTLARRDLPGAHTHAAHIDTRSPAVQRDAAGCR